MTTLLLLILALACLGLAWGVFRGQLTLQLLSRRVEDQWRENTRSFTEFQKALQQTSGTLETLAKQGEGLQELEQLFRAPQLRGEFGEAVLESLLESTLPRGSFELQYRISGLERVDAVVKFPNALLPIDSKFPRECLSELLEAKGSAALETARKRFRETLKHHAKSIADKYIKPEVGTANLAICFLPSEALYLECLRDPELIEAAAQSKVFFASANTLRVTLFAAKHAFAMTELSASVESLLSQIQKAQKSMEFFEDRFADLGKSLEKAAGAYSNAETHWKRYKNSIAPWSDRAEHTETAAKPAAQTAPLTESRHGVA